MKEKNLPNNLEAEESVLGACFLSKYALQKACETLTEDSFYDEKNVSRQGEKIYDVLRKDAKGIHILPYNKIQKMLKAESGRGIMLRKCYNAGKRAYLLR